MRSFPERLAALAIAALVPLIVLAAQTASKPPPSAGGQHPVFDTGTSKTAAPDTKLDPPLEAVARAWPRLGVKGAERECAARTITLDRLRVAAVIHVQQASQRPAVEKALRRAWGEVVTSEETRIHGWLPVPAMRRISRLREVTAIYLEGTVTPLGAATTETGP